MNIVASVVCEDAMAATAIGNDIHRRIATLGPSETHVGTGEGALLLQAPLVSHASQPCFSPDERFVVAGDLRLDETGDLADLLGAQRQIGHTKLVALAYARWGTACPEHLSGEFAFLLFDRKERTLFGARDRFGLRPLYLSREGGHFMAASDPAMLVDKSSGRPDMTFISGYLAGLVEDEVRTADRNITRLPPAHSLFWKEGKVVVSRYWSLKAQSPPSGNEVVEGFRHHFIRAVGRTMVGPARVGTLLSGGLDSSSICVCAARLQPGLERLHAFAAVYPETPTVDESPFIDAVERGARFSLTRLNADAVPPLEGVAQAIRSGGAFLDAAGSGKTRRLFSIAREHGVPVLLDGHGGDEVVWFGYRRVLDLAREGRWLRALAQIPGMSLVAGDDPLLLVSAIHEAAGPRNRFGNGLRRLGRSYRRWRAPSALQPPDGLHLLSAKFAADTDLADRLATEAKRRAAPVTDFDDHAAALSSPRTASALETLRRLAAGAGVEVRFPFFDVDLVQYCLGLPSSEKLRAGWPRAIMRRALADELPRKVRRRRTKADFGPALAYGMARWHTDLLSAIAADTDGGMGAFYDMDALRPLITRLRETPERVQTTEAVMAWRAAYLFLWLEWRRHGDDRAG